jgi:hypothetical protein
LNVARQDEHSHSMTFRFLRPDGRGEVWLEQVAVTHFDLAGKPTRINGLATDVTERSDLKEKFPAPGNQRHWQIRQKPASCLPPAMTCDSRCKR